MQHETPPSRAACWTLRTRAHLQSTAPCRAVFAAAADEIDRRTSHEALWAGQDMLKQLGF